MTKSVPSQLPLLPIPGSVIYPGVEIPVSLSAPRLIRMVRDVLGSHRLMVVALQEEIESGEHQGDSPVETVGCLCKIAASESLPNGRFNVTLMGLRKVIIGMEHQKFPYRIVEIRVMEKEKMSPHEMAAFKNMRQWMEQRLYQVWLQDMIPGIQKSGMERLTRVHDSNFIALVGLILRFKGNEVQRILEEDGALARLMRTRQFFEQRLLQRSRNTDTDLPLEEGEHTH